MRVRGWAVGGIAAVTVLAGGVAMASIPDTGTGVFHGCYSTKTGALRLVDPSKGQKCAAGEKAVSWDQAGITWRGPWAAATGYQVHDAVSYNGSSYLAVKAGTGKTPSANPSYWAVLAKAGTAGKTGAKGRTGPQGPSGPTLLPEQDALGVGVPDQLSGASYGFDRPAGMAFDGHHLWITNASGNSVTEVNASNGSVVRVLSGASYGFHAPSAIAFDGSHLWITNSGLIGSAQPKPPWSVTEVNASDGSLVRVLSDSSYEFRAPDGIAFDGSHVWITNLGGGVTEVNASNGSLVQVLSSGFSEPLGIAFDGTYLWITNVSGNSVTKVNASTGLPVSVLSGASYGFNSPQGIAFDGSHLWITNNSGNSVTEVYASDGSAAQLLIGGYGFNSPQGIAFDGSHMWITNSAGNSVTEVNVSDGSLVQNFTTGFNVPSGIAFDGSHMWVANYGGNSLTVLQGG